MYSCPEFKKNSMGMNIKKGLTLLSDKAVASGGLKDLRSMKQLQSIKYASREVSQSGSITACFTSGLAKYRT